MVESNQTRVVSFSILTALAIGGLGMIANLHPMIALSAGAFTAALLVNLGKRTTLNYADILGATIAGLCLLLDRFGWTSMVLVPSLAFACLWLRFPQARLRGDDNLYLPPLIIALGIGILFFMKKYAFEESNNLIALTGLSDALNWLDQIAMEGADQLSGDTRKQYLEMINTFRENFPYYYFGGQLTIFTVTFNLVSRLQRKWGEPVQPFLLFKIKERYVLLLIFAMGVEIVRYLFDLRELLYISRSFFVFLGTTYFLGGLAVLGFLIVMGRLRTNSFLSRWLILVLCFLIIIKPIICVGIGLLDIWFDFRRLKTLKGG